MAQWLESGSGVYWVCGKAGSGKSTLMKHIFFHRDVPKLLQRWLNPEAQAHLKEKDPEKDLCALGSFIFLNLGHHL